MEFRRQYIPPEVTILDFCPEMGYSASTEVPMNHVDQFQLMMSFGDQQSRHAIEEMGNHQDWGGIGDNHFFN